VSQLLVAFDLLVALALVSLGAWILFTTSRTRSAMLFVVFGLVLALAWIRLGSPDIALAEAAVGAGITGALLLETARRLSGGVGRASPATVGRRLPGTVLFAFIAGFGLLGVLVAVVLALPREAGGLGPAIESRMGEVAVDQPVTAVLLDFRAYDTWLEVVVLLVAVVAALAVVPLDGDVLSLSGEPAAPPLQAAFVRLALPLLLVLGAFLLARGTFAAGGAFQGGAVLAAAALLAWSAGIRPLPDSRSRLAALLWSVGHLGFATFAVATLVGTAAALSYPDHGALALLVALEVGVTVTVASTLATLFFVARRSSVEVTSCG
jgi:multisubunit Na+/H+ antiporter MnhB subunit